MVVLETVATVLHFGLIKALPMVGNLVTSIRQFKIADRALNPEQLSQVLQQIEDSKKAQKNKAATLSSTGSKSNKPGSGNTSNRSGRAGDALSHSRAAESSNLTS